MIIVMKSRATKAQIQHVIHKIKTLDLKPVVTKGTERTVIGVVGQEDKVRIQPLEAFAGVEKVIAILKPYKLVSREFKKENTIINAGGVRIGGKRLVFMAGPCSVENRQMILTTAKKVKSAGAQFLRGGAFKPRTSPYAFQGLGEEGLRYLREAADRNGIHVISEIVDPRDIGLFERYVDIIQVGARNMHNFQLLKEVGQSRKPVLLKRGLSATIQEFLLAGEYLLSQGNFNVIFCERGIRTYENATRFTLDVSAIPVIKKASHLPVFVDPSHPAGNWEYVPALAKAAVAAGADGLIIETHPNPEAALSDGPQSLKPERFAALVRDIKKIAAAVGRTV